LVDTTLENLSGRSTAASSAKQPLKQHWVDAASEPDLPVDLHDGHAFIELRAERGIGVDIDELRLQFMLD
jgi:hypothetical protein